MIRVFKRSATDWRSFARAKKITVDRVRTEAEAQRLCASYNDNRTRAQIRRGTKLEYEKD